MGREGENGYTIRHPIIEALTECNSNQIKYQKKEKEIKMRMSNRLKVY